MSPQALRSGFTLFGHTFAECSTGGNCVGLVCDLPNGEQLLLTAYDEAELPTSTDWALGHYDSEHQQIRLMDCTGYMQIERVAA